MPIIHLNNRTVIAISGQDRFSFLQGLITNDLELLKSQEAVYACLLTPQGKFLYDFFIIEDGDRYLLDVEARRHKELIQHLSFYKLRSDVQIEDISQEYKCFASLDDQIGYADPRHPDLGYRAMAKDLNADGDFDAYDQKRICLAVPDGAKDLKPQLSTLHEGNLDQLNAISWTKGCYLGQELTARIEHRGLVKKRLLPVQSKDGLMLELVRLDQIDQEKIVIPECLKGVI